MTKEHTEYGDPTVAINGEILRSTVGSQLHGIAIDGTDDHDEMAVYIEPPEYVLGFLNERGDYVWRSQPEGARSGPGDTDLVSYSLKKYLGLAYKGNPTALLPLFAPEEFLITCNEHGYAMRALRHSFLSKQAVERFLGYMESQRQRMLGQSKRHVPNRPELIEKYGFDVKYASHAVRLAEQALEIATYGTLTLPMPEVTRQEVISVKRGEVPQAYVLTKIERLDKEIREVLADKDCPLPQEADVKSITDWAVGAQLKHWGFL